MDPSYNNFGSFDNQNMQVGIIATPNDNSKKTKKLLLAVLVIIFIIVIAAVLFFIRNNTGNQISSNLKDSFNIYANYFLYDEAKKDDVPDEWEDASTMAFFNKATSEEDNKEYYEQIWKYYDDFYSSFEKEYSDNVPELLFDYKAKLRLLTYDYLGFTLSRPELVEAYIDGGEEGAKSLVEQKASTYKELKEKYGLNYYDSMLNWGLSTVELIKKYQDFGCIKEKAIDYLCASSKVDEEVSDLNNKISLDTLKMQNALENSRDSVGSNIFTIKSVVYSSYDNNGEDDES